MLYQRMCVAHIWRSSSTQAYILLLLLQSCVRQFIDANGSQMTPVNPSIGFIREVFSTAM